MMKEQKSNKSERSRLENFAFLLVFAGKENSDIFYESERMDVDGDGK